ncbi:MAG: LptA/OstA family protein [Verrucomicrobiota bacterium]|nr:LptA/OstA family protein [Verrucomicrobiota bacterium]
MTVVTSDRLTFDYGAWVAVFEGNVVVADATMQIAADRLVLTFAGTNELKSAEATGHVRLAHPSGNGRCDRVVYSAEAGRMVMSGDALLVQPSGSIGADEIAFFLRDRRICFVRAAGNVTMRHVGPAGQTPDFLPPDTKKRPKL